MELANHLEIHEIENNYFLVQHIANQKYVKLGTREVEFLQLLTNEEDLKSAEDQYTGSLTEVERAFLFDKFSEWGFLDRSPIQADEQEKKWKFNWKIDDITTIKFLSINPDQWLTSMLPVIRTLLHPIAIVIYTFLILSAGVLLVNDQTILTALSINQLGIGSYITIYIMLLMTTVVHEIAHGMVCKHYGGRVKQMGAMLFYLSPAMFCDVSDTYKFKKKSHKLAVLFAGIYSQWIMTSIALVIYYTLASFQMHIPVLFFYGMANLGLSIINMLPLVKLDGYWMLSHGLGIVNLRTKAFHAFFKLITPWKRNRQSKESTTVHGSTSTNWKEQSILLAYGFAAVIFAPFFWGWGLYSIQQRLYSFLGGVSFLITAAIACVLLYHGTKFIIKMNKAV